MEIERKFLLSELPKNLNLLLHATIEQSYVSCGEPEVRIRKKVLVDTTSYILCFKSNGDIIRSEHEIDITQSHYESLLEFCPGVPITKDYYVFDLNGYKLECSIVDKGKQTEFIYAEIEFDSVHSAELFPYAHLLGKEVTFDPTYKMKNFWKRTRLSFID